MAGEGIKEEAAKVKSYMTGVDRRIEQSSAFSKIKDLINKENAKKFSIPLVLIILIAAVLVYLLFFNYKICTDYTCFSETMSACRRAVYINEEPQASWQYTIQGMSDGSCNVDVKLLNAKKGELGLEKIVGYDMSCFYPTGTAAYPEKDLSLCHGRLKEEFQAITIERLHTLVIENLGKLGAGINAEGIA
jgi:hypothetical protein